MQRSFRKMEKIWPGSKMSVVHSVPQFPVLRAPLFPQRKALKLMVKSCLDSVKGALSVGHWLH